MKENEEQETMVRVRWMLVSDFLVWLLIGCLKQPNPVVV